MFQAINDSAYGQATDENNPGGDEELQVQRLHGIGVQKDLSKTRTYRIYKGHLLPVIPQARLLHMHKEAIQAVGELCILLYRKRIEEPTKADLGHVKVWLDQDALLAIQKLPRILCNHIGVLARRSDQQLLIVLSNAWLELGIQR